MVPRPVVSARQSDRVTQLARPLVAPHVDGMLNQQTFPGSRPRRRPAQGPIIDQDGREVPREALRGQAFDFRGWSNNTFGAGLTREQRIARIEALAKLLDVAFVIPGTNMRYGIDGLIGLVPVVGDIITTAMGLWIVREARAIGAPWYLTARMLGNVAVDGVVGVVPLAGDAFDVMFKANMRNIRMLRRWLDKQR